jgi:hypothetical protein
LRRLAGDELSGVAGSLAGADLDVETSLLVEALFLGHHEAGIRALIDPVQPNRDFAFGLRAGAAGERESS